MSCGDGFVGNFAVSKCGHDKGMVYIIIGITDDKFVLVANGENRPLDRPKRKNIRHLFITKCHTAATNDLEIKRSIKLHLDKSAAV
jgi:ribosomal protein L14E/L6E/L27E